MYWRLQPTGHFELRDLPMVSGFRGEAKPQEWVGSIEPEVGRLIFGLVQSFVSSIGQVRYVPGARPGGRFYEVDLGAGAGHADLHL